MERIIGMSVRRKDEAMGEFGQVQELRSRLLRAAYDEAGGVPGHPVMLWRVAERLEGLDTSDPDYVDTLTNAAQVLGARGLLNRQSMDWGMFSLTANGIDAVEGTEAEAALGSVTFNVGNAYGSIFGTQQHAEMNVSFDFRSIEAELQRAREEVERRGGPDAEELREMLTEVEGHLHRGETLEPGQFSTFMAVIQRNGWIAGPVAGALLGWAMRATGLG